MIILGRHPLGQTAAIVLGFYLAYLGLERVRSLHFGHAIHFKRDRHDLLGALALIFLLFGMAGGLIMVARYLEKPILASMHGKGALVFLPFLMLVCFRAFTCILTRRK